MKDIKRLVFSLLILIFTIPDTLPAVAFKGQIRIRPETRSDADFNSTTRDSSSFIGSRIRLSAIHYFNKNLWGRSKRRSKRKSNVKISLQDTRNWGEASNVGLTDSGETIDIHEGYVNFVNFMDLPVQLIAGRQELSYGDERLIGNFNWSNQARAFDAFKLIYSNRFIKLDGWAAKRQENNRIAGQPDTDRDFYGIYATFNKIIRKSKLDLYVLFDREADTAPPNRTRRVYTFGARVKGKVDRLDFTIEAPYQAGDNGTQTGAGQDVEIDAYAFAGKLGYTFRGKSKFRLGGEYAFASGDDNPADNKSETFNNLYPTNHKHYGYMDYNSWRNINAWNVNMSAKPYSQWDGKVSLWFYRLAKPQDGWYNSAGAATGFRAGSTTFTQENIGKEINLIINYRYSKWATFQAGYGHFFLGEAIEERVGGINENDSDWSYLMITVNF